MSCVYHHQDVFKVSERHICNAMVVGRSSHLYCPWQDPEVGLRMHLKNLAENRVCCGFCRLHFLLTRENWHVDHKRFYRLNCEEDLSICTRSPKRRRACRFRAGRAGNDVRQAVRRKIVLCPFKKLSRGTIFDAWTGNGYFLYFFKRWSSFQLSADVG